LRDTLLHEVDVEEVSVCQCLITQPVSLQRSSTEMNSKKHTWR